MTDVAVDLASFPPEAEFVFRPDLSENADVSVTPDGEVRFAVDGVTTVDQIGDKISQRAEFSETAESDDANTSDGPMWYRWSLRIEPETENPSGGAKLHLGQFHQRSATDGLAAKPALMFNLTETGDLVAQFESAVGKRAYLLASGGLDGQDAKGYWIDIVVGADWRSTGGWTEIYMRGAGESAFRLAAYDEGMNTSTGTIFFKFGVYRSFLERDPLFALSETAVSFRNIERADRAEDLFGDTATACSSGSALPGMIDGFVFAPSLDSDPAATGHSAPWLQGPSDGPAGFAPFGCDPIGLSSPPAPVDADWLDLG